MLTDSNVDDATTGVHRIDQVGDDIAAVIGDAAYDTRPFYDAAVSRGAEVVVPPTKNAVVTGRRCPPRDATICRVHDVGRRQWKTEAGYHRQGKAENTLSGIRRSSLIGFEHGAATPSAAKLDSLATSSTA